MTEQNSKDTTSRDWPVLVLALSIPYLVILLPFAALIGAKPEVIGGAIAVLASTLGGIIGVRAVRK